MSDNTKRWLLSSAVTFATGFAAVFVLSIDDLTLETIRAGALTGVVFSAARAGVKALLEAFLSWRASR